MLNHICEGRNNTCPLLQYIEKEQLLSDSKIRNSQIRKDWVEIRKKSKAMQCIDMLAEKYFLSKERIQAIIYAKEK